MITLIKPNTNIDFMSKKKILMVLSAILLIFSLVPIIFSGGLNYGIDFVGGFLVQVKFTKATDSIAIKHALKSINLDDSLVQSFGRTEENEYLIRAQKLDLILDNLDIKIAKALTADYSENGFEIRRIETVGPKVGNDLRQKALLAIFFSLLLIAIYISGRFESKWISSLIMSIILAGISLCQYWFLAKIIVLDSSKIIGYLIITSIIFIIFACYLLRLSYAMGAIVSIIHDIFITVGIYTMLGKEFNLSTVAALLTIIGYSINDTIIVYDRLRENLLKDSQKNIEKVLNDSINQTLSRTILTVGTVLLVLISLYILGGSVIEDFALTLLIGTAVGTYSSVYVASPMLLLITTDITANIFNLTNINKRSLSSNFFSNTDNARLTITKKNIPKRLVNKRKYR